MPNDTQDAVRELSRRIADFAECPIQQDALRVRRTASDVKISLDK